MTPLWLAAAATVPASSQSTAWRPAVSRRGGRGVKAALAAGVVAPSLLCAGVAAASPPPLVMGVAPRFTATPHHGITAATVRVTNRTGDTLTPHFASRTGQGASRWWTVKTGPASLAPHASATYEVSPHGGFRAVPRRPRAPLYLIAVTANPMTITTAPFPSPPA